MLTVPVLNSGSNAELSELKVEVKVQDSIIKAKGPDSTVDVEL